MPSSELVLAIVGGAVAVLVTIGAMALVMFLRERHVQLKLEKYAHELLQAKVSLYAAMP